MAIILFLSIVALAYFSSISAAPEEVCETENCLEYANKLRNDMNTKINPCDNFYEYVCGNWNKNHPVPKDEDFWSQFSLISNTTKNHLREILTSGSIDDNNKFVNKAKRLYKGCMDRDTIEKNGTGEILNYTKETGGWPIIMSPGEWENIKKPWQTVDSEYNVIMGTSPFVNFAVQPAREKPYMNNLLVRPSFSPGDSSSNVPMMKSDDDLFTNSTVVKNMKLIKNIAGVMAREGGFEFNETQVEKDAQGIVRFLHYLEHIAGFVGSKSKTVMTIKEFQEFSESSFPYVPPTRKIDWLQRIRQLFTRESSIRIDSTEKIIVQHKGYFKGLFSIPTKILERDIVNTIQWWFVKETLAFTNPKMVGIRQRQSRWKKCIKENELQYALAYVQVEKDVDDSKARVFDMVEKVKIAMKEEITKSKWPNDNSKKAAKKKIDSMTTLVGYPDWYKDPTMLGNVELNKNLLKGSSYLENVLLLKQFELQQKLAFLGEPFDKWSFVPSIIDANAYQYNAANIIAFPIGILQKPMFNAEYPDAVNYGGIGTDIGHEMSHAFDSKGIHFDKHGNRGTLWSNKAISKHDKRCQRFIDQFNNYGVPGDRTLDENIADSTGVRAAFKAYKIHTGQSRYIDKKLSGLEHLSSYKLFFVSFAWAHCMNVKAEFVGTLLNDDVHSPSLQQVNGALSNSKDFSNAFECKKNSPMNPSEKCTIW